MKQIIICTMLLIFSTISFCQQSTPTQDYLQKSKRQKTTALILAGGGLILEISGAIAYKYGNSSIFLFGAGLISQVVSIPFFIASGVNKRKARKASLSFKFDSTPMTQPTASFHATPAISFKIDL